MRWLLLIATVAEAVAAAVDTAREEGTEAAEATCASSQVGMCDTKRIKTEAAGPSESSHS